MTRVTAEAMTQAEKVQKLYQEATATLRERRDEPRHPFWRPVSVHIVGLGNVTIEGFCKDLSLSGMGLLTNIPLPTVNVALVVEDQLGEPMRLLGEVTRTEACGRSWYTSGVKFHRT